ncbi:uncharacterized protein P174DRAFT_452660 [Aspergillus novofumigatus IBT 16806]|uniref:Uncharacterized protein n=1 Tax=Aspergillus novofumigatus (strain IBT 16806) TaxID=1392255 RepID=A0A2I1C771_ASPN1|nr:uncharacterized protein P174DRAFT_452660 [Aspergillus novofumigatus IBT 16806]PKX93474.1 hypothetical protein P174DRAFT_452660 [Aspergillus novofumigatus IBT 16806]
MFLDQGAIRKLSMFYYEPIGLGDVLVITARPVTEKSLRWCEATMTREDMLVAIVTALYDGPPMGTVGDAWLRRPDNLLVDVWGKPMNGTEVAGLSAKVPASPGSTTITVA